MLSDDDKISILISTLDLKRLACMIEDEYDNIRTLSKSDGISTLLKNFLDDESEHIYKLKELVFSKLNEIWDSEVYDD